MICRKCNNQIVDTARFCPFCGEPTVRMDARETKAQPVVENADKAGDAAAQTTPVSAPQPAPRQAAQTSQAPQASQPQSAPRQTAQASQPQPVPRQAAQASQTQSAPRQTTQAAQASQPQPAPRQTTQATPVSAPQSAPRQTAQPPKKQSGGAGGSRVKLVPVLIGAVVLFAVSFFAAVLLNKALAGHGSSGSAGATEERSAAYSEDSYADDAAQGAAGGTNTTSETATYSEDSFADDAAQGVTGSTDITSEAVASSEDSYADDAVQGRVGQTDTAAPATASEGSYAGDAAREDAGEMDPDGNETSQTPNFPHAEGTAREGSDATPAAAAAAANIPVLKVEQFHAEGANGYCEENYMRVSLGDGTDVIFPELNQALIAFSDQVAASADTEYADLLSYAEETKLNLSVNLSIGLARADENLVSLICGFSDYTGGAHGYYYNWGAAFDNRTGKQLTLTDLCTDTGRLAEIIADDLYAEDANRFTAGRDALRQTIRESYVEAEDSNCWVVMPEGIMFYFPPYGISYYAAGQPYTLVKFADHPDLFNADYCTVQSEYMTYLARYASVQTKTDVDGDGSLDEISAYAGSAEVDSKYYYQNLRIYVNGEEYLENTPIFRDYGYCMAKVGGRTLYIVHTDNLDDTVSTYVFDLTGGTATVTDTEAVGFFSGSSYATGHNESLQSVLPGRLLLGGDAGEYSLTAEGTLVAEG